MRDAIFYHSGKSHWKRKNVSDRYTERNQYPDFGQYSSASYTKTHCQSTSKYLYPGNCWWIGYLPLFLSLRYIYPPDPQVKQNSRHRGRFLNWHTISTTCHSTRAFILFLLCVLQDDLYMYQYYMVLLLTVLKLFG